MSSEGNTNTIHIKIGELAVSKDKVLTTIVGSCIALCLYDEKSKVIGMAHIMLPNSSNGNSSSNGNLKAKYADQAIKNLLQEFTKYYAATSSIKAKIVGGASVFANENDEDMFNIGRKNVERVKELLSKYNIKVVAEDVGGRNGRYVAFYPNTQVKIKSNNDGERVI